MKSIQSNIGFGLGVLCLVLSIYVVFTSRSTQQAQLELQIRQMEINAEMQRRQTEIDQGANSEKFGNSLLQEMGATALKNKDIRDLLAKYGYNIDASSGTSSPTKP